MKLVTAKQVYTVFVVKGETNGRVQQAIHDRQRT